MSDLCSQIQIGPLALDVDTGRLRHWDGREQALNPQQVVVFERLMRKPGAVVTMERLIAALYIASRHGEPEYSEGVVRVHLCHIRKKLAVFGNSVQILTRWRAGYWLCITDGAQQ